jgi:hypothetical protein
LGLLASAVAVQQVAAQAADNIPMPTGAQNVNQDPRGNGTHYYFRIGNSPAGVVNGYKGQLQSAGWKILSSGSGGSSWGGNGGLTATKGQSYLVLSAGGPAGETYVNLCVWPSQPNNTNC